MSVWQDDLAYWLPEKAEDIMGRKKGLLRMSILKGKEDEENEKYLEYVSKIALPATINKNPSYLNSLQRLYTIRKADTYHIQVAKAIETMLSGISHKRLSFIDENSRSIYKYYLEYYLDWKKMVKWEKRLDRRDMPYLSDAQYTAVICAGSFHSDGYCRQQSVRELGYIKGTMPYLFLRLNDWVKNVREEAYKSILLRFNDCNIDEILHSLPIFEKVKKSGRRDASHLQEIEIKVEGFLQQEIKSYSLWKLKWYETAIRNTFYRLICGIGGIEPKLLENMMNLEKSSYGKKVLFEALLQTQKMGDEKLLEYMRSKSSVLRYYAMDYYYNRHGNAWNGLENMLLDRVCKIRDTACYIMKKHRNFDVLQFYKEQWEESGNITALLGIGEYGSKQDLNYILPHFVKEERIQKAALTAYGMVVKEKGEEKYLEFLQKESSLLYVEAYRLIRKYSVRFGAEPLYKLYQELKHRPVSEYLIKLLILEPSWQRLPFLLLACKDKNLSDNLRKQVLTAINKRSMYGKVSRRDEKLIRQLLESRKDCISEQTKEDILFDLKYVVSDCKKC